MLRNFAKWVTYWIIIKNKLDRPRTRSNPKSETWTFDYDLRDNRVSALKPDGTSITSTYDELSHLTALNGGTVARAYTYDPQIDLTAANENSNGPSLTFGYDQDNRLETASVSNLLGGAAGNNAFTYGYDALDRPARGVKTWRG